MHAHTKQKELHTYAPHGVRDHEIYDHSLLSAQYLTVYVSAKTKVVADSEETKHNLPGKAVKKKTSKDKTSTVTDKASVESKADYTEFEQLQYPELDPRLSCAELRKLCNGVKLEWCSPASYFSAHSRWEELEPEWITPISPATDPSAEREPMMAKFDEIWCPVLADVEESLSIIPPTFQYFSDGTVMHSALC